MKLNKNKGITLIALVITIVILLILAGISISALTQTGIFGKAKQAEQRSKEAQEEENATLGTYENEIDKYVGKNNGNNESNEKKTVADNIGKVLSTEKNIELQDIKGNKIVVPAGFKIVSDGTTSNAQTVDKGIVVEDATGKATNGSQFVWIPVGTITKADGSTTTINLDRYTFADGKTANIAEGTPTPQGEKVVENYYSETASKGNTVAKSITNFKNSVTTNGGYYIGRYEARQKNGQITEVKTDTVWNNITQPTAADKAQKMYDNTYPFTSDLMNSYAWDTATLFAQSCGTNPKYSRQNSLNTSSVATTGT